MNPIESFAHNSNKLTEPNGDQYTFVKTVQKCNYELLRTQLI